MSMSTNLAMRYTSRRHGDERHFAKAQPYHTEAINHLYGTQWKSYASNVREVPQEDGSLVTEYIFRNPSAIRKIRASSVTSSDEDRQSRSSRFAQIKATFEPNAPAQVMASPPASSPPSSQKNTARDDSERRSFVDSPPAEQIQLAPARPLSTSTSDRSQSSLSERSTTGSSRYLHSVDETDEEPQHFPRQGEERRENEGTLRSIQPIDHHYPPQQQFSQVQYEMTDEYGNTIPIDNVYDIIKASGMEAREVQQPDGTIVREYVIDDPQLVSQVQAQRTITSPSIPSVSCEYVPPPPPRLFPKPTVADQQSQPTPVNIEPLDQLYAQQPYQYISHFGRRIEFLITDLGTDAPIDHRSFPSYPSSFRTLPINAPAKEWDAVRRQRTVSNTHFPSSTGASDFSQQIPKPAELTRSASSGTLRPPDQFAPIITEPIIDWSILRQQDPEGQIDSELVRQFIQQRHQLESSQISAHLLPRPTSIQPNYYPQTTLQPYQEQPPLRVTQQIDAAGNRHTRI